MMWQKEIETMPREELKKLQSERLVWQVNRMYEKVELFLGGERCGSRTAHIAGLEKRGDIRRYLL